VKPTVARSVFVFLGALHFLGYCLYPIKIIPEIIL
jgi:hypothetical protein